MYSCFFGVANCWMRFLSSQILGHNGDEFSQLSRWDTQLAGNVMIAISDLSNRAFSSDTGLLAGSVIQLLIADGIFDTKVMPTGISIHDGLGLILSILVARSVYIAAQRILFLKDECGLRRLNDVYNRMKRKKKRIRTLPETRIYRKDSIGGGNWKI